MVSDMNIFVWKLSKIAAQKKFFFLSLFSLLRYCLTVFLPPLPEVGCPIFLEIRNPWGKFFFVDFALVHPPMASVLLSASVKRCFVSRMRDFFSSCYISTLFPLQDFIFFCELNDLGSKLGLQRAQFWSRLPEQQNRRNLRAWYMWSREPNM